MKIGDRAGVVGNKLPIGEWMANEVPAGDGLRWIAHGFSALWLSDHQILEREFFLYDAFFAECKKRAGGAA